MLTYYDQLLRLDKDRNTAYWSGLMTHWTVIRTSDKWAIVLQPPPSYVALKSIIFAIFAIWDGFLLIETRNMFQHVFLIEPALFIRTAVRHAVLHLPLRHAISQFTGVEVHMIHSSEKHARSREFCLNNTKCIWALFQTHPRPFWWQDPWGPNL